MTEVADAVIARFAAAYPALGENGDFIQRVIGLEEQRFVETFERGLVMLRHDFQPRTLTQAMRQFTLQAKLNSRSKIVNCYTAVPRWQRHN